MQFGFQRAGFYSYELLERIVGIPVTNVECIVDHLQELRVGDEIILHPRAPGIPVVLIEKGKLICFGFDPLLTPNSEEPDPPRAWSMYVEAAGDNASRLLLRGCTAEPKSPSMLQKFGAILEASVDFLMEQRMMRSVRRLAESENRMKNMSG